MLLTLTAASRSSETCNLDTSYMVKTDTKFIFVLAKLTKTWKKAHIVLPRAKEFGRAKGPGESIFQAFKGPKIQNFGNHCATSEIY